MKVTNMERKVILYIAESLDGFIARKNGSVDWLTPYESSGEDYGYKEFYDSIGTIIMGSTTYKQFGEYHRDKLCFVFSSSIKGREGNVTFVNRDIREFIEKLNSENNKNIWLVGGGSMIDGFLKHGLIDEFIISIIPTLLGDGIPLFKGGNVESQLKLLKVKSYDSGLVQVHYERKRMK